MIDVGKREGMSDTPRTDAASFQTSVSHRSYGECVSVSFARDLERENARLRSELEAALKARFDANWGKKKEIP